MTSVKTKFQLSERPAIASRRGWTVKVYVVREFLRTSTSGPPQIRDRPQVGWLTELVLIIQVTCRWAYHNPVLGTVFRKNFCASRFPKFIDLGDYSTSLSGTFIFDHPQKYLFIREIWFFKVVKYQVRRPVMRQVSIGNAIETWIGRNDSHCISYRNLSHRWTPNLIFHNFEKSYLSDE